MKMAFGHSYMRNRNWINIFNYKLLLCQSQIAYWNGCLFSECVAISKQTHTETRSLKATYHQHSKNMVLIHITNRTLHIFANTCATLCHASFFKYDTIRSRPLDSREYEFIKSLMHTCVCIKCVYTLDFLAKSLTTLKARAHPQDLVRAVDDVWEACGIYASLLGIDRRCLR